MRSARRAIRATRGSNSRPRCCASSCKTEDPTLDALSARVAALESGAGPAPVVVAAAACRGPRAGCGREPAPAAQRRAEARTSGTRSGARGGGRTGSGARFRHAGTGRAEARTGAASAGRRSRVRAGARRRDGRAHGPLTLAKVRSLWSNVRTRAEGEKPSMAASLGRATIDTVTDDAITLRMPDPITGEALKRNIDTLRSAVDGVFGRPIEVRVVVGAASAPAFASDPDADDEIPPAEHPDDVARYAFDRLL